jgi:hypothetical protein
MWLTQNNPYIGVTEHNINNNEKVVVLINYNSDDSIMNFRLKEGWKISNSLYGAMPSGKGFSIKANDALVLIIKKL